MSLLRKPKTRTVGSAWERLWSTFGSRAHRKPTERKPRRLMIDPLEERTLLSVSPASIESKLLTTGSSISSMHMAEDAKGDFVVVWQQNDTYTNTNGNTVTGSNIYGEYLTNEVQRVTLPADVLLNTDGKSNTYATVSLTYGGDTVQELTFSATTATNFDKTLGVAANAADTISGTFKLSYTVNGTTYATNSIQFNEGTYVNRNWTSMLKSDVTAAATTLTINDTALAIDGSYVIQVGAERMLVTKTAPGTLTVTRGYGGTTAAAHSAGDAVTIVSNTTLLQEALRALGTANSLTELTTVTVSAVDSEHYTLDFNDNNSATNLSVNQLRVTSPVWGTGFLPAAEVTTVSKPVTISGIKVSPSNPTYTALSIIDAFEQFSATYYTASDTGIATVTADGVSGVATPLPTITVTPVQTAADPNALRTFNIEFTGEAACTIVPLLGVQAWNDSGTAITTAATVTVVKQDTSIFRINPPQLDNPFTQQRDLFNATVPAVAMDASGNFVVTWQAQVPDYENPGSVSDIFAREYKTGGSMTIIGDDGVTQTTVTGLHLVQAYTPYSTTLADDDPLKVASDLYTFRVNTHTANAQTNPSVGMDANGNFTIAWTDHGQPVSYFNGIYMRQYAADGSPNTADEVMVSPEDTTDRDNSYTVCSADGHTLVMWVASGSEILGIMYDATGTAMSTTPTDIAPASAITACFDPENNIAFSFTSSVIEPDYTGLYSNNVYMEECSLDIFVEAGQAGAPLYTLPAPPMLRALERVNDTALTWYFGYPPYWANDQVSGQIAMDADGDLTDTYSGFGPDTNLDLQLTPSQNTYLQSLLTSYANESGTGLSAAQTTWLKSGLITFPYVTTSGTTRAQPTDVDSAIDQILLDAKASVALGGHGFTDVQVGRLRAVLEDLVNLARGEGSGVMYTQWDADPTLQTSVLTTDSIVNDQRDGNNAQFIITLEKTAPLGTGGNVTLDISIYDALTGVALDGGPVAVNATPHYALDGTTILYYDIAAADAQAAISAALAANPYCVGLYQGTEFVVRQVTDQEMQLRAGTKWDLSSTQTPNPTYVFEVTFTGDLHDTPLRLTVIGGGVTARGAPYSQGTPGVANSSGSVGTPQYDAQLGMTREGSYTVTYLQDNLDAVGNVVSSSIYFRIYNESTDTAGPIITDATLVSSGGETDDLNISNSATFDNGVAYAVIDVTEALYNNLSKTGDAASNPANYSLLDSNGKAIAGAISAAYFGLNKAADLAQMAADDPADYGAFSVLSSTPTNQYEIVIAFSNAASSSGVTGLTTGTYTLTVKTPTAAQGNGSGTTGVTDVAGNALGYSGYNTAGSNYSVKFSVDVTTDSTSNKSGTEIRANQTTDGVQTTTSTGMNVSGDSANTHSIACDSNGEFVVVWLQYESDGTTDVYMRLYDNAGNPLTNETMVNTYTTGNQTEASVAMDADGDFVIVWASEGQDAADNSWGIYGQRFDAVGDKVGGEFHVNTKTANDQVSPAVAMDSKGDFVVVWATQGQSYSYFNGIEGQVYDAGGNPLGYEFAVNSQDVPGTGLTASNNELHPAIAMSDISTFVVVWTAVTGQTNGIATDSVIMGRMFTWDSTGATPMLISSTVNGQTTNSNTEFKVSVGTAPFVADPQAIPTDRLDAQPFMASNAAVAMNSSGDFIVTWEAFEDNDWIDMIEPTVNSYGIYYRQYNGDGTPKTAVDEQANQVVTALDPNIPYTMAQSALYYGNQLRPSVSMDLDGDFTITWDGNGSSTSTPATPENLSTAYDQDNSGVFARSFHSTLTDLSINPLPPNPATSTEWRVNSTSRGIQESSSVAMTTNGGIIVAWSGAGTGDSQGVFFKMYKPKVDIDGPTVTDATLVTTGGEDVDLNVSTAAVVKTGVSYIVLDVSEPLYDNLAKNGDAASNPANYFLYDSTGAVIPGAISAVYYGFNEASSLATTIPVLDPTPSGKYEIVIAIDANGPASGVTPLLTGGYTLKLVTPIDPTLNNPAGKSGITDTSGNKLNATGANASGSDYSITFAISVSGDSNSPKYGTEILVNQTTAGVQTTTDTALNVVGDPANNRCVACDDKGDFVVVWLQYDTDNYTDVYMRLYDNTGNPLTDETLVNTYTTKSQTEPSVAMDADGDYVIVWSSQGQDPDGSWGIYGQRFNSIGGRVGSEFRVNTTTANDQVSPDVAMDSRGDYIVVWATQGQQYSYFNDVEGQMYAYDGRKLGGEFRVNSQDIPGAGSPGGITASNNELHPSIAMSDVGTFMVTWTGVTSQFNGVALDSVIMGRMFNVTNAGAVPMVTPNAGYYTGAADGTEFQVNVATDYIPSDPEDYVHLPAAPMMASNAQVAMDPSGEVIVVWEAFEDNDWLDQPDVVNSYGIYFRGFDADGTPKTPLDEHANELVHVIDPPPPNSIYQWSQNLAFMGDQLHPAVSMDADGDFSIAWDGNGSDTTDVTTVSDTGSLFNQDQSGVWVRQFHAIPDPKTNGAPYMSLPAVSEEKRINDTSLGVQDSPSLAMSSNGTFVAVWSGKGIGDSQGVFFKIYKEPTDTAGPIVTGFVLPGGIKVASTTQVTQALQALVITFDEDMNHVLSTDTTNYLHSVLNPANYELLKNGSAINGGIVQVYYGLDIANQLGTQYGLNIPRMNKYEAVLIVDGNGSGPGTVPLSDGQYQLVVLSSVRDVVGNPMRSTGLSQNGSAMSGLINVTVPTGQETKVNSDAADSNTTYGKYTTADTANSVAADADGDYVVAWTDTTPGNQGVWAKLYQQTSTLNPDGSRSTSVSALKEMEISADPNASDIAVARSTDGDFVVTWSSWNATTDWDVYAQRFDASGTAKGSIFRVNSTTASTQRYSAVAMDAEGDFVITWQSLGQDGDGYGIYAQAYNALGNAVGGTNEEQAIDFLNGFAGTFCIRWDNDNNSATPDLVSAPISYTGNAATTVAAVQSAMTAMGAQVNVVSNGLTEILIQYTGATGNSYQQPIWISPTDVVKTGGGSTAQVTTKVVTTGVTGEVQVNETTAGDQISPAVAMDAQGNFIITWTSFGQDGDNAIQSSICGKRFTSASYVWSSGNIATGVDSTPDTPGTPLMNTIDNPDNHIVPPGSGYDAICQVNSNDEGSGALGSGELLVGGSDTTGYWVLTAAHVVFSESRHVPLMPADITCTFFTSDFPTGVTVQADQVIVNPGYIDDDHFLLGDDIALVHLPAVDSKGAAIPASAKSEAMQINTNSDEVGQTFQFFGYGIIGSGLTGTFSNQPTTNYLHQGWNVVDSTGAAVGYEDSQLCLDFDDGTAAHDAFGLMYDIHDTDTALVDSKKEAFPNHGDSGGPMIIDGKIAGVCSGGDSRPSAADIDGQSDSSFGEIGYYTRLSSFASWVNSFTNCLGGSQVIPGTEFVVTKNDVVTFQFDGLMPEAYLTLDNESGNQSQSSVAMDSAGDFTIAWTSYGHDGVGNGAGAGVNGENGIYARRYNSDGSAASDAFQVNQTAEGQQQHPKVSMDASGDFVVAWEGNQNGAYDIYARRYARTSLVKYAQDVIDDPSMSLFWYGQNSSYMSDTMTFNRWVVDPNYFYDGVPQTFYYDTVIVSVNNGAIGGEIPINSTTDGDQRFPGVALDAAGDAVVVWSGNGTVQGQADPQGVFYQRLAQTKDAAGPTVGEVLNVTGSGSTTTVQQLMNNSTLAVGPAKLIITFGEALSIQNGATGAHSILNLANWQFANNDGTIVGGVSSVQYGWNEAYALGLESTPSDKWEAVITLDGNPNVAGNQTPGAGTYKLTISSAVQDTFGNAFDGGYTGTSATAYHWSFTVTGGSAPVPVGGNTTPPGNPASGATDISVSSQYTDLPAIVSEVTWDPTGNPAEVDTTPAVATDAAGDFVVVWDRMMNTWDATAQIYKNDLDVEIQRFNKFGQPQGVEFSVNTHAKVVDSQSITTFAYNGDQAEGAVAMDANGDFVVVWAGTGYDTNGNLLDASGIFAQIYDSNGKAVGSPFLVNHTTAGPQDDPAVAMDANGDFVVTWTSADPRDADGGIFARRFNVQGVALTGDIQVNSTTANRQENSDVAMDGSGNFVVVWQSDQQDGNSWGVFGRRFAANGTALSGEMAINTYTTGAQDNPAVAMDSAGDFVVAWQSFGEDGSGYGIYAQRYSSTGVKAGSEFRANTTTANWQITPDVAMANTGAFTITWSGYGQSNLLPSNPTAATVDYGIYAHMYKADGTDYLSTATGKAVGEFQVNSTPVGAQSPADAATVAGNVTPAIAYGGNGTTISITWAAPQTWIANGLQNYDRKIYARVIVPGSEGPLQQIILPNPVISSVGISQTNGKISWNVVDPAGVSGCTLKIDSKTVSGISGPYTAASGWNYITSYGTLAGGSHSYTITATDKGGRSSTLTGNFTLTTTTAVGPTIGGVATSSAKKVISWNAVDSDGVASASITINGSSVKVNGPYAAASGVNFSASYGTLAAGDYPYVITATDKVGNSSSLSGTLTVPVSTNSGPTISGVATAATKKVISWNAVDSDGVASASITINGSSVKVNGPYAAASGVNFSASYGTLAAGDYPYVITATDKVGNSSSLNGTLTVPVSTNSGPTISGVVVAVAKGAITWNAADSDGIASVALTIDTNPASKVYGPYAAASGFNYSGMMGSLQAGVHNYVITATDKAGNASTSSGSFTLDTAIGSSGPTISGVVASLTKNVLTWNAFDSDGVASVGLTIDNGAVSGINGPYAAAVGANYSWKFGSLAAGTHNYVIRATDKLGNASTSSGSFTIGSSSYSNAALSALSSSAKLAWVYDDLDGLAASTQSGSNDGAKAVDAVMAAY